MATKGEKTKIESLQQDVTSLKFDMDRVIKPGIDNINKKLDLKIYPTKTEFNDLKKSVEATGQNNNDRFKAIEKTIRLYPFIEKLFIGFVTLVLMSVGAAVLALVIMQRGG